MTRRKRSAFWFVPPALMAIGLFIMTGGPGFADDAPHLRPVGAKVDEVDHQDVGEGPSAGTAWDQVGSRAHRLASWLIDWYGRTPPPERVTWGGLVACGGLGLVVLIERTLRLRERLVVPPAFTMRFVDHLHEGKLDCGQALDHCERNPSPAARVALAAVRRWGRPAGDLERGVAMAHRVETERLRRNVGTLRRVAALSALLGVLGTLFALGRALESIPPTVGNGPAVGAAVPVAWGPALAAAITPLSTGLIVATLALAAYDGVLSRVEELAGALDRLGAETIEAIAMSAPPAATPIAMARPPHFARPNVDQAGTPRKPGRAGAR
jgi:biopolymer transport protein ExbB